MNLVMMHFKWQTNHSGFNVGITGQNSYVICNAKKKTVYEVEAERSEWVTAIEYICADENALLPIIVFKGDNFSKAWIPLGLDVQ